MPLEMQSVADAMKNATDEHLKEMRRLLTEAEENLANDEILNSVNMAFHRQIAIASGNTVLVQILDVLRELFTEEQRLILNIFGSRERDHREHVSHPRGARAAQRVAGREANEDAPGRRAGRRRALGSEGSSRLIRGLRASAFAGRDVPGDSNRLRFRTNRA